MPSLINSEDYFGAKLKELLHQNSSILLGHMHSSDSILVDKTFLDQAINAMIAVDIPITTATKMLFSIQKNCLKKIISVKDIKKIFYNEIKQIIGPYSCPIDIDYNLRPQVIVMCGLNGAGKTTTIWKMLHMLSRYGWRSTVAACDTTRASAKDQFTHCSLIPNVTIVAQQKEREKPTAIVRRAIEVANENFSDVVLVDTPGFSGENELALRDTSLLIDAIESVRSDAPHNVVLVVDATNGQEAKKQLAVFRGVGTITGMVITKIDIAKHAGFLIGAVDELRLPVHGIGLGCEPEDLQDFSAEEFAEGLSGVIG